ncbi:hypothetical protein C1645_815541 [Glomus cerebriforme]|uniref:Uncharacterized protein n=1 Tax=Glomus cerebriforme TaxID=658196 RepID=A0A397TMV4_9GLOM|nr:hypothetical protein C1645_815541 [Glomus cerebriforme]
MHGTIKGSDKKVKASLNTLLLVEHPENLITLKRIERLEEKFKQASTVIISKVEDKDIKTITTSLQLKLNVIEFESQSSTTSSKKFNWKKDISENMQAKGDKGYIKHLSNIIKLPPNMEWYNAKTNQQFLSVIDQQWLPFNIKEMSDIAILNKNYSRCYRQEVIGARLLFELKKVGNIKEYDRKIMTWFSSQDLAICIIQEYINKEKESEESVNEFAQLETSSYRGEFSLLAKRRKLDITAITNDIANFKDFEDEIPITEMKQKLIEHFLRETFIPSSTYGQLVANMSEDNINNMLTIPYIA